jgi:hypothetical protein
MFSKLDRDYVGIAEATGFTLFQRDERPAAEIQRQAELSTLFALTQVLGPLATGATNEVIYVCVEPPPAFLRRAIAASGGKLQVHQEPPLAYEGVPGSPADLADEVFRRLAYRVLRERNAELDEPALETLMHDLPPVPTGDEDELPFWTRLFEFSAVIGELLRAKFGGRWVTAPGLAVVPFAFRLGIESGPRYILCNVVGKTQQFLENGGRDGAMKLLRNAEEYGPSGAALMPVRMMLKPAHWPGRHAMVCQPLVTWKDPRVAVPWITYGEELPDSFSHLLKASLKQEALEPLHAQALNHLKTIELDPRELVQDSFEMFVVLGQPYAAEKVLDADFLRSLHTHLRSPSLLVGIPRKGFFFAMSARVEPRFLKMFADFCQAHYKRRDAEPICATPLLIEDGTISGFVWAEPEGATKLVRVAEPDTEPPRGLFNRILGRMRS